MEGVCIYADIRTTQQFCLPLYGILRYPYCRNCPRSALDIPLGSPMDHDSARYCHVRYGHDPPFCGFQACPAAPARCLHRHGRAVRHYAAPRVVSRTRIFAATRTCGRRDPCRDLPRRHLIECHDLPRTRRCRALRLHDDGIDHPRPNHDPTPHPLAGRSVD